MSSDGRWAIQAERLGKQYLLAGQRPRYATLRETITSLASFPFRGRAGRPEPFWALRDASFEVERGGAFGIIGANGSGKSTLLKVLARITEPSEGRARIRGRIGSLLEVGTGFHPELTGRENIFLNGAILGMSRDTVARRFDEIVAFSGVERFLETPVKHYSSGMHMRLAFAVAAHLDTDVLLVDEVLAVGDVEFQRRCLGRMEAVSRSGERTVLFVSHNLGAVASLCQHAIWLHQGRIHAQGTASEVTSRYLSAVRAGELQLGVEGENELLIERVVLLDRSGRPTHSLPCGDPLTVEVHYRALTRIESPALWLSIVGDLGPLVLASMLFDGRGPEALEGRGTIACTFELPFLLPQTYRVRLGIKAKDGVTSLLDNNVVAEFSTCGPLAELGLPGQLAERYAGDSTPIMTPYTWRLPDGRSIRVTPGSRA